MLLWKIRNTLFVWDGETQVTDYYVEIRKHDRPEEVFKRVGPMSEYRADLVYDMMEKEADKVNGFAYIVEVRKGN